jgi:glycosyltransferase involved in cell wall biosynthesis
MSNQIKIFVDCHVFDGTFQGTTTYLKGIYSQFILDQDFHFFLASNNNEILENIFGHHKNVTYIQYKYSNKYVRILFEIPSIIRQNNIDFAHFQYIVPPFKYCKYIVTVHDILFKDYPQYFPLSYKIRNRILFKWSANYSDIVLTVSEYSQHRIQHHFNIKNVVVTPNAIDPVYYELYSKDYVKKQVLKEYGIDDYWIYISRWEPRKNHLSLLKVFVDNQYYKKYTLVFIGNDALKNKAYNQYFEGLSNEIKQKIIRLKQIDFVELVKLLRGAIISVYPSLAEGFGIPPLEALAARVPSICSNTTAMSDFDFMIENNMTFQPHNLSDIKNCLDSNINETVNEKVDAQIREQMKSKYNWKLSVDNLKDAIFSA